MKFELNKNCKGITALHYAAEGGHVEIVKLLLQKNAGYYYC